MKTNILKRVAMAVMPAVLLALSGCSSTSTQPVTTSPPAQPAQPVPATPAPAGPELVAAGFDVETATATATIESINAKTRDIVLNRADGTKSTYTAGPEVWNFDQLKVNDVVVATLTKNLAVFLVKGGAKLGAEGRKVITRAPKGAQPGATVVNTVDINAKVLDVNYQTRRLLLQYETHEAKSVQAGPNVDLMNVKVGDDVLVRAVQTMAITVVKP